MYRALFFLLLFSTMRVNGQEDISGFWKSLDEEGTPQCIFAVYEYNDLHYGRIIGLYNDKGEMDDTIYHPKKRAPGVVGTPYYSGLDIIWGLMNAGVKFKGKILDPQKGNIYNSELWVNNEGDLVVRGKFLIFGRNQIWPPALDNDFPKGFKKPDLSALIPSVPEVN